MSLQVINYKNGQCIQHQQHAAYVSLFKNKSQKSLVMWSCISSIIFFSNILLSVVFLSNEGKFRHIFTSISCRQLVSVYQQIQNSIRNFSQTKFGFLLELILIHFYSGGLNDFSSVPHVNAYIVVNTFER